MDHGLPARIDSVRQRIREACDRAGRSADEVLLLAVTKTWPVEAVHAAHAAGLLDLGENYAQEWRAKADATAALLPPIRWHFIGHLQSKKAKLLVGRVALVHAVDRPSVLETLASRSVLEGVVTPVLLEVNVAGEASKSGCRPDEAPALAAAAWLAPGLELRGLMTVAPDEDDPATVRPVFRALRELRDRIRDASPAEVGARIDQLSMGMSHDLEVAVEEGATIVRVGSALFGTRSP